MPSTHDERCDFRDENIELQSDQFSINRFLLPTRKTVHSIPSYLDFNSNNVVRNIPNNERETWKNSTRKNSPLSLDAKLSHNTRYLVESSRRVLKKKVVHVEHLKMEDQTKTERDLMKNKTISRHFHSPLANLNTQDRSHDTFHSEF